MCVLPAFVGELVRSVRAEIALFPVLSQHTVGPSQACVNEGPLTRTPEVGALVLTLQLSPWE